MASVLLYRKVTLYGIIDWFIRPIAYRFTFRRPFSTHFDGTRDRQMSTVEESEGKHVGPKFWAWSLIISTPGLQRVALGDEVWVEAGDAPVVEVHRVAGKVEYQIWCNNTSEI